MPFTGPSTRVETTMLWEAELGCSTSGDIVGFGGGMSQRSPLPGTPKEFSGSFWKIL